METVGEIEVNKVNNGLYSKKVKTVLDQFNHLTSCKEQFRLKSSINIIKHLNNGEEKHIELKHALTRIIRGLGSSTNNPRIGFYTILVALLNVKNDISVEQILECMEKYLHTAGSNSRSENADILTGQILASGAIVRSNLWAKATTKEKIKIVECILNASQERTYQGLLAFEFLNSLFERTNEQEFYELCPLFKDEISKPLENYNLDSLYLLLTMKKKYPHLPKSIKSIIIYPDILVEENIIKLCKILMIIPGVSSLQHPIYNIIGTQVATSDKLHTFVDELDRYLDVPSRNKILVAIKLFTVIFETLEDVSLILIVLTKNFIHQMLNRFKTSTGIDQDNMFKQSINTFFDKLLGRLKQQDVKSKIKIGVLKKLLFSPGTFIFEKITHSKVIQNITWSLNSEGVEKLENVYRGVIEGTEIIDSQYGHGDYWLNNDKLYAAHLLIKLLNHSSMKEENEWKTKQLIFLMELGLLKENKVQIGTELAASLKTAFFGALDLKLSKLEELHTILSKVVFHLNSKLSVENLETILRASITPQDFSVWEKTIKIITKIEKKKKKGGLRSVFLTLFLHLALLLFNDAKLAVDSLNELFVCYEKTRKRKKNSETLEDTLVDESSSEDVMWIEVVTDLFLNFLSQNSHLLRNVVNLVFPYLCEYMTSSTVQQLVSVLDPNNENPLSKGSSHLSDNEDELDKSDEEEEDESDTDDDDVEDETVNDKLRMALHQALRSNEYQTDEESIDIDQMSETEGERLDLAIADAFRQHRPNRGRRKNQNEDQRALTHFRVRVLDLIEIYITSTPSMIITLEMMLPLLKTVEFCLREEHQSPLLNRLKACLKKLSSLKKFGNTEGVDDAILCDLLGSLLEKGTKNTWIVQDMTEQISDCCSFLIKCSDVLSHSESTPKKVKKLLKSSLTELINNELNNYFTKRDYATPVLVFKKLLNTSWEGNLTLVSSILKYIFDDNVKVFKKTQGLEMAYLFYTNQRYLSSRKEEIKEILKDNHEEFLNKITQFFNFICDTSTEKKLPSEKFFCNLFKLLITMKSGVLAIEYTKWSEIAEGAREYRSRVSLSKDAKTAFNKLCNSFNVSNVVKMRLAVNSVSYSPGKKNKSIKEKKHKKTKNSEKLKLKKEAKELRLQSLSEGFKDLDFNADDSVMEAVNDVFDEEDAAVSNAKKKKETTETEVIDTSGSKKLKKKRKNSEEAENNLLNGINENRKKKKLKP